MWKVLFFKWTKQSWVRSPCNALPMSVRMNIRMYHTKRQVLRPLQIRISCALSNRRLTLWRICESFSKTRVTGMYFVWVVERRRGYSRLVRAVVCIQRFCKWAAVPWGRSNSSFIWKKWGRGLFHLSVCICYSLLGFYYVAAGGGGGKREKYFL